MANGVNRRDFLKAMGAGAASLAIPGYTKAMKLSAADADLAVCAAKGKGFTYRHGRKKVTVSENKLIEALTAELRKF
jgi:hypothetical protein